MDALQLNFPRALCLDVHGLPLYGVHWREAADADLIERHRHGENFGGILARQQLPPMGSQKVAKMFKKLSTCI